MNAREKQEELIKSVRQLVRYNALDGCTDWIVLLKRVEHEAFPLFEKWLENECLIVAAEKAR